MIVESRFFIALGLVSALVACSGGAAGTPPSSDGGTSPSADGGGDPGRPPVAADGTGTDCKTNDDCKASNGLCLFHDGAAIGYCSRACNTPSDCPSAFYCARAGNVSHLYCILESSLLDDCNKDCQQFDDLGCLADGALSTCLAACTAAAPGAQVTFDTCATSGAVSCTTSCVDTLCAASKTSCGGVAKDPCRRDTTLDVQCTGMGKPGKGYQCPPDKDKAGCASFPIPGAFCCGA
jgi:hypothetical protein